MNCIRNCTSGIVYKTIRLQAKGTVYKLMTFPLPGVQANHCDNTI